MPPSSNVPHPLQSLRDNLPHSIPWNVAPRSGLHVTAEMRKLLAQPGFLKTKEGGNRLRSLYINQRDDHTLEIPESIGFNPETLSSFGRYCYYGVLRKVVEEFENGTAPALDATETEYEAGYATIIVWGSQRVSGIGFDPSHREVIEFLISHKLPLNLPDICGLTPLHHFMINDRIESRNIPILRTLLVGGANPNVQDRYGGVPLFNACDKKYLEAIEVLMEFGADLSIKDADGYSPMMIYNAMGPQVSATVEKCLRRQRGEDPLPRSDKRCGGCLATDKTLKNCSRCQVARYCSVECQKKDWPTHKKACKSFAQSDTVTVKPFYDMHMPFSSNSEMTRALMNVNSLDPVKIASALNARKFSTLKAADPKDVVIKVQVPVDTSTMRPQPIGDMLVYTKKKDFACVLRRSDDPTAWDKLYQVVTTKSPGGLKAYFAATLVKKKELVIKISEVLACQPF
ncbi:hypothetical protein BDN70DRAFT_898860 [Pholiota conissans]|uniref:MYND-type domain-containing protein n=1 Tax=Pholiota conissans TaxID=109636 RepID=A0A9P6CVV2_9AGAR|nr:hypothetical protein BDN70DRAFT_898860 [Pholiota conissans]